MRLFFLFLVLVIVFVGVSFLFSRIVIVTDKSVDYRIFWKEGRRSIEKGDYVIVRGKGLGSGKILTKKVLCISGEKVLREGLFYYCCSDNKCEFLHSAVLKTPRGRELIPWDTCRTEREKVLTSKCEMEIPEGYYYLGSSVREGYDSRYQGLFSEDEIIEVVRPLI